MDTAKPERPLSEKQRRRLDLREAAKSRTRMQAQFLETHGDEIVAWKREVKRLVAAGEKKLPPRPTRRGPQDCDPDSALRLVKERAELEGDTWLSAHMRELLRLRAAMRTAGPLMDLLTHLARMNGSLSELVSLEIRYRKRTHAHPALGVPFAPRSQFAAFGAAIRERLVEIGLQSSAVVRARRMQRGLARAEARKEAERKRRSKVLEPHLMVPMTPEQLKSGVEGPE